ncbi:uncharacterized protein N0V89_007417 [Didymosphaeria variabile]|uniref:Uncharacterized protein n=1 Tax=Didymosphaeria variabile TaxID=1932322 RepID=A0A9W8XKU6_9PLEO|nr:uncharacterized protein N0V89_007417 [Didymosphaeria variabile]KAJ4352071.1 hypothetical protein N0V89_007417 [Didymosphaeria variabile]
MGFVPEYSEKGDQKRPDQAEVEEAHPEDTSNPVIESAGPQQSTSPQTDRSVKRLQDTHIQSPSAERYEFALHGLLALGNGNSGGDVNAEPEVNFATIDFAETDHATLPSQTSVAMDRIQTEPNPMIVGECQERPKLQPWPSISTISSVEMPQMTDERVLEFLKHYRYNIAPWMDICDMNQCFGCEVLQLSKISSPVRLETLALAEASLSARHQLQDVTVDMLARMQRQKVPAGEKVHKSLLITLETVKAVVTNLSGFWNLQDSVWCTRHVLEPLLFEVNQDPIGNSDPLAPAAFWLIARLRKYCIILIGEKQNPYYKLRLNTAGFYPSKYHLELSVGLSLAYWPR